jgi:Fe2+ or Zn2+ uptake regulation protein
MFDEVIPTIVDILIANKGPMTTEKIVEESDFDASNVARALTLLKELGLITKAINKSNVLTYQLIKELKGIHLAKAAQIGIDLSAFDGHFIIDNKERALALELATQAEKIKHLDVKKRKPLMQKRSYFTLKKTDDVAENLIVLLEASSASLHDYLEKMSASDPYLKLLLMMHDQAEQSLQDYSQNFK